MMVRSAAPRSGPVDSESPPETGNVDVMPPKKTPKPNPFAKTGGLAEVVGALPLALARLGHRVTLVLPRYRGTDISGEAARPTTLNFGVRTQQLSLITQPIAEGGTAGA